MSKRYKGALLSATPPTTTGGTTGSGSASGMWTIQQEMQAKGSNAWPEAQNYIEDVFSTYLYTGTGSAQTITTGIDTSTKGGLVWIKSRSSGTEYHNLFDTSRGAGEVMYSNTTDASASATDRLSSFTATGFTLGSDSVTNASSAPFASWSFRKQPKFFDVVTWTGNNVAERLITHNLGSRPGCIIIKCTSNASTNWVVWHRQNDAGGGSGYGKIGLCLNLTTTSNTGAYALVGYAGDPNTQFSLHDGGSFSWVNNTGWTYVAYVFAHNAGGFGLTGTDNVISCGSYTGNGALNEINLGYEAQWVMIKNTSAVADWYMYDNIRGMQAPATSNQALLPNSTNGESAAGKVFPISTGFAVNEALSAVNASGNTYVYIAIRRGPMKTPTDGTKVFMPVAYSSTNVDNRFVDTTITPDAIFARNRTTTSGGGFYVADRFRGNFFIGTASVAADSSDADSFMAAQSGYGNTLSQMGGFVCGNDVTRRLNYSTDTNIAYAFKRAPGFFDEVCYTANSALNTNAADSGLLVSHNLGVVPELIILKNRTTDAGTEASWAVWYTGLATQYPNGRHILLESSAATVAATTNTFFNGTGPTATNFRVWNNGNSSTNNYVAYLFATCPGVSKVGSFTNAGSSINIDCGFAGSARFVLLKLTTGAADWYVYDTARGIVAGNDPYLTMNTSAVETTASDDIDPYTGGFTFNGAIWATGTYIFLAIA